MINNITLQNVRWINESFKLKKWLNVFTWKNGTGKSTIIKSIIDWFRWEKISVKEWEMSLSYGDSVINRQKNKLFSSPKSDIDLCIPWFLMWKQKVIKWVNSTTEDRRNTISNLLWIDRTKFFLDAWIDYDLKWLSSQLREMEVTSNTYTRELLELEQTKIEEVKEPKEVKLVSSTIWNKWELDRLKESLKSDRLIKEDIPKALSKPIEVILVKWNESEYNNLKKELANIITEGKNIPVTCSTCWQDIKDAEQMKAALRIKYNNKAKEIKNFDIISSNIELYEQYRSDLELYNQSITRQTNVESRNIDIENQVKEINKQIKEFKLIESTEWNEEEYNSYKTEVTSYEVYKQSLENKDNKIKDLKSKIKWLSTQSIKDKIELYKDTELNFINYVDDKLTVGDLKFKFYKRNISPNSDSEFSPIFTIEYKWIPYNELSWWQQWVVDIIVSYLFISKDTNIDFILIDNAEIWSEELNEVISNYLNDIQIITTRITNKNLELKHKL